jgi:biotin-dependent carboxylase-like uncharacterized protein
MIEVIKAGPLATVQDLGRPGWAHLGVPRSGALDPPALRLANRLVANPEPAAGIEVTLTGCRLRAREDSTVAVTGARSRVRVDGEEMPFGAPVRVPAGSTLEVGRAVAGVRTYVAVAGGIEVPPVLGSRSTDTLSGIGPPRLVDGVCLPVGRPAGSPAPHATGGAEPSAEVALRVRLGPRDDWFTTEAIETLLLSPYAIGPMSNRVGARLTGASLPRARGGELPSEGVVLGAVQVPPGGEPLVFLADHPTTGGYPVIAVVDEGDLPALAQARPGATVRFHGPQR